MSPAKVKPNVRFENLLVLTDLSPESAGAIPHARALASTYGSKIHVLHVIDPFSYRFGAPEAAGRKRQEAWDAAAAGLSCWKEKFLQGVETASILVEGEVSQAVLDAVREQNIDLLLLASHGAKGLERVILGSIGEEVFRTVPCPVMTIGPGVLKRPEGPARFSSVLFPTDLSSSSIAAIPYLGSLMENHDSALSLLHLADPGIQSPSERQRIRERIEKELRGLLPEQLRSRVERVIVEFAPVAASVVEFAVANQADVIVLGVKSGGALARGATHLPWAIAHQIIADAPCPVLTIRATAKT